MKFQEEGVTTAGISIDGKGNFLPVVHGENKGFCCCTPGTPIYRQNMSLKCLRFWLDLCRFSTHNSPRWRALNMRTRNSKLDCDTQFRNFALLKNYKCVKLKEVRLTMNYGSILTAPKLFRKLHFSKHDWDGPNHCDPVKIVCAMCWIMFTWGVISRGNDWPSKCSGDFPPQT